MSDDRNVTIQLNLKADPNAGSEAQKIAGAAQRAREGVSGAVPASGFTQAEFNNYARQTTYQSAQSERAREQMERSWAKQAQSFFDQTDGNEWTARDRTSAYRARQAYQERNPGAWNAAPKANVPEHLKRIPWVQKQAESKALDDELADLDKNFQRNERERERRGRKGRSKEYGIDDLAKGGRRVSRTLREVTTGVESLTRGLAIMGLATGEGSEELVKFFATISGGASAISGVIDLAGSAHSGYQAGKGLLQGAGWIGTGGAVTSAAGSAAGAGAGGAAAAEGAGAAAAGSTAGGGGLLGALGLGAAGLLGGLAVGELATMGMSSDGKGTLATGWEAWQTHRQNQKDSERIDAARSARDRRILLQRKRDDETFSTDRMRARMMGDGGADWLRGQTQKRLRNAEGTGGIGENKDLDYYTRIKQIQEELTKQDMDQFRVKSRIVEQLGAERERLSENLKLAQERAKATREQGQEQVSQVGFWSARDKRRLADVIKKREAGGDEALNEKDIKFAREHGIFDEAVKNRGLKNLSESGLSEEAVGEALGVDKANEKAAKAVAEVQQKISETTKKQAEAAAKLQEVHEAATENLNKLDELIDQIRNLENQRQGNDVGAANGTAPGGNVVSGPGELDSQQGEGGGGWRMAGMAPGQKWHMAGTGF